MEGANKGKLALPPRCKRGPFGQEVRFRPPSTKIRLIYDGLLVIMGNTSALQAEEQGSIPWRSTNSMG